MAGCCRRPLTTSTSGTVALNMQRTRLMDEHSRPLTADCYGSPLTFSGQAHDCAALAMISLAYK